MKQECWEKLSLVATRALTLAGSSYECGIKWDVHYCKDELHYLATRHSPANTVIPSYSMAYFLKEFEIPLHISCHESTLLLLVTQSGTRNEKLGDGGSAPLFMYWKYCSPVSDSHGHESGDSELLQGTVVDRFQYECERY